ncbi:MAG: 7TM diverse intracellular signaling domain-containing protein, partial [Bacteroidota bacterium]|nr:7TM diverse intracellular signaling domain-containing protein [Bacteroidota bacterium]
MKRTLLLIYSLSVGIIASFAQDMPVAKDGVIDLRNWDFDKESIVHLNGDWEFYWEKFYSPEDFIDEFDVSNYILVPFTWNSGENTHKIKYPSFGYATYRLKVLLPNESEQFTVNIKKIYSAYKVWIDGCLCFEAGKIATNKQDYKAGLSNFNEFYYNQTKIKPNDTLEIIIQVANYSSNINPGVHNSIAFGTAKSVVEKQIKSFIIGFFAIGIFLIMGIYYLFLFLFRTKNKSALYFSMMTFAIALRTLYNQEILENFFNNFYFTNVIDYGSVALFGLFLSLYFFTLLKKEFGKIMIIIFVFISIVLFIVCFLPLGMIEFFYYFYFLIVFLPILYIVLYVIPKSYKNKKREFFWAFLGTFILLMNTVSDLLSLRGITDFPLTTTYGFILFIIFQSMYLAKKYTSSLKQNEQLNVELTYKNENLEKIIEERTSIINQQKIDLEEQNEELLVVSDEIRAQNDEMKTITDELADKTEYLQKQTDELKLVNKELEELSIVATQTDNVVLIFNENLKLEWVNTVFYKKYNINSEDELSEYDFIENSSFMVIEDVLTEILETKKLITYEFCVDCDTQTWIQASMTPIFENDKLIKVIAIETDISELKKAQKEISVKKNEIEESIHYAKRIQNAILPNFDEFKNYFESFIIYRPKDIVSGDFFWTCVSPNTDKEIFVAVSDCTGHGVPGAFMSLIGTTLLNEIINQELILSPDKILEELNKKVKILLKQNKNEDIDGMDVIICKVNIEFKILTFAGARRPLFYFDSEKNKVIRYITDRLSIGGMHSNLNNKYSLQQIVLNK